MPVTSTPPSLEAHEWLQRPVFKKHQRLTPERLNRLLDHQAARLRYALLGLAGPGVVYGFSIDTRESGSTPCSKGCLFVHCGLAIDRYGRQLFWPGGWIRLEDMAPDPSRKPGMYTLKLHYAEKPASGGNGCGPCDDGSEWTREGVTFSLEHGCYPLQPHCPDPCSKCIETRDYVCGRLGGAHEPVQPMADLRELCAEPGPLCGVGAHDWLFDPKAGLPLACVEVSDLNAGRAGCDVALGFDANCLATCEHRPHVYRNPLLFELVSGCHVDLARVERVSFQHWLDRRFDDPVPWHEFAKAVRHGLSIWFTKPIDNSTLHGASVFVTVIVREQDSFFRDVLRLPMERLKHLDSDGALSRGVCLEFPRRWVDNQIESQLSRFNFGAAIEITIRGAFLRDACGNMLDARPIGLARDKPGQSMPGDDFVVAFSVAPRRRHEHDDEEHDDEEHEHDNDEQYPTEGAAAKEATPQQAPERAA
jgi:hypothetical protein